VSERFRVLVLGGYGHFGGRISRALAFDPILHLTVAGRDAARAESLAGGLGASAQALDHRSGEFPRRLAELRPDLVIHAAGPFQGQDYAVAAACIAAGVHYVDLADGRAFVSGIGRLDAAARERGVAVISGASTLPAVTSAVVDALRGEVGELDSIEITIAPAQRIPRGEATLASVLGYCGRPIRRLERGRWRTVRGWQAIGTHGYRSLGLRWKAACDVPDLELFPQRYPGVKTVRFDAALELWPLQWGMWLLAAAARARLVRDWSRHAARLQRIAAYCDRWGSDVGGMHVTLRGSRGTREWELVARAGHGPEIPAIPAILLARKFAAGRLEARGAMPCMGLFSLAEFRQAVAGFAIDWSVRAGLPQ